jgi:hypothetical protein
MGLWKYWSALRLLTRLLMRRVDSTVTTTGTSDSIADTHTTTVATAIISDTGRWIDAPKRITRRANTIVAMRSRRINIITDIHTEGLHTSHKLPRTRA